MATIRIEAVEEGPDNWALVVAVDGEGGLIVLQRGYSSEKQAALALIESLTFAPPDLTALEEAMGQVGQLLDAVNNLNEAMTQVGERLNGIEDRMDNLEGLKIPQVQTNPLLRPRVSARVPGVPPVPRQAPPPIRRTVVHTPHVPTGGAFIPGQGGDPSDG